MPPRVNEPTLVTIHKRIDVLTKQMARLNRHIFKELRIDAENVEPNVPEMLMQFQQEVAAIVYAMGKR